jgi:hypothetical protein
VAQWSRSSKKDAKNWNYANVARDYGRDTLQSERLGYSSRLASHTFPLGRLQKLYVSQQISANYLLKIEDISNDPPFIPHAHPFVFRICCSFLGRTGSSVDCPEWVFK